MKDRTGFYVKPSENSGKMAMVLVPKVNDLEIGLVTTFVDASAEVLAGCKETPKGEDNMPFVLAGGYHFEERKAKDKDGVEQTMCYKDGTPIKWITW